MAIRYHLPAARDRIIPAMKLSQCIHMQSLTLNVWCTERRCTEVLLLVSAYCSAGRPKTLKYDEYALYGV